MIKLSVFLSARRKNLEFSPPSSWWQMVTSRLHQEVSASPPTWPDLEPALSESFKTTSHGSRNRQTRFCQFCCWDTCELIWMYSKVNREAAPDLSLQLPPLLPRWAEGGDVSRTRYNSLWQHLKWLLLFFFSLLAWSGGRWRLAVEEGWCNRAEITVLTSQSVRVSEDETSDRLRRCRRCQKHQESKHTRAPALTHVYSACWTCCYSYLSRTVRSSGSSWGVRPSADQTTSLPCCSCLRCTGTLACLETVTNFLLSVHTS